MKGRRKLYILAGFLLFFTFFLFASLRVSEGYVTETGRKWADSSATALPYYVNPTNTPTGFSFIDAVQTGSQKWNDVSTSYFNFSYQGTTTIVFDPDSRDGYNTWWWNLNGTGLDDTTLARNTYWTLTSTGEMVEFDVEINGTADYVYNQTPGAGQYDLLHVVTHEAGHSLWLGHSSDASAMMYAYYHESRNLIQDDIDGITALYPNDTAPTSTPTATTTDTPVADSGGGGGGGGCFIATAAFGSYMQKDVMVLRYFRDRVLLTNIPGKAIVKGYYKYSPPIADKIAQNNTARAAVRLSLLPMVLLIKHPLLNLFFIILIITCGYRIKRRMQLEKQK